MGWFILHLPSLFYSSDFFSVLPLALVLFSYLIPATTMSGTPWFGNTFSGQKVFLFMTLIPSGYVFVAALNKRRNPLRSRKKHYHVRGGFLLLFSLFGRCYGVAINLHFWKVFIFFFCL